MRFLLISILVLSIFPAFSSPPQPPLRSSDTIHARETSRLRTEVVDSSGKAQPLTLTSGKLTAQLKDGEGYGLKLTNLTDRRILVVMSVDMLNPRSGTRAYQGQPGLVLGPGQTRLVEKGKPSKRSPLQPLIPLNPKSSTISLMVFEEAVSYPIQGTGMPPAPFGPENYRVNSNGQREWVPPEGYPFRKKRGSTPELTQLFYSIQDGSSDFPG